MVYRSGLYKIFYTLLPEVMIFFKLTQYLNISYRQHNLELVQLIVPERNLIFDPEILVHRTGFYKIASILHKFMGVHLQLKNFVHNFHQAENLNIFWNSGPSNRILFTCFNNPLTNFSVKIYECYIQPRAIIDILFEYTLYQSRRKCWILL